MEGSIDNLKRTTINGGTCITSVEQELTYNDGSIFQLQENVRKLEEHKIKNVEKVGGIIFKDEDSVQAWVSTLGKI